MSIWRRAFPAILAVVALTAACRYILPERYAVNAPLRNLIWGGGVEAAAPDVLQQRLHAPPGFSVALYQDDLAGARFLRFTPAGDLLVSEPRFSRIRILHRDKDGDGHPDDVRTVVEDLNMPHGLDLHDGWLYVAETDAVGRIRFDPETRTTSGKYERLVTGIPTSHHWTRTVRIGPDGFMYVSIGSSCNVCVEKDRRRAAIVRYKLDGSGEEIYATGLRNSVGFDWQPGTDDLYATDNGRDLLGDDFPPDELNRIVKDGFYGFPFANGDRVPDPDFGKGHEEEVQRSIPPAHAFRAHNAALGITFVRGAKAPAELRGAALVALHGSWNRTRKDGYKVVSLHWQKDGKIVERDFLTGFEKDEDVIGRPVDVAEGPDGAFYVSDDYAGAVYRVVRGAAPTTTTRPPGAPVDPLQSMSPNERDGRLAMARSLFARYGCRGCHEPGEAAPGVVTRPLANLKQRYTLDSLAAFLAAPTPPMPVADLSPEERRSLAVYLLTSYP